MPSLKTAAVEIASAVKKADKSRSSQGSAEKSSRSNKSADNGNPGLIPRTPDGVATGRRGRRRRSRSKRSREHLDGSPIVAGSGIVVGTEDIEAGRNREQDQEQRAKDTHRKPPEGPRGRKGVANGTVVETGDIEVELNHKQEQGQGQEQGRKTEDTRRKRSRKAKDRKGVSAPGPAGIVQTEDIKPELSQEQKQSQGRGQDGKRKRRRGREREGGAQRRWSEKSRSQKGIVALESTGIVQGGILTSRTSVWKISPSSGGRFSHLDPLFTQDEEFLLLAHPGSLQVYSTKTSLLVRAMELSDRSNVIRAFKLDPKDRSRVCVGTSDARIHLWDWTIGKLIRSWKLRSLRSIESIAFCADEEIQTEKSCGIVYVGGPSGRGLAGLWRFELFEDSSSLERPAIYEVMGGSIPCLQVFSGGTIITATNGRNLLVGNKRTGGSSEGATWGIFRKYPMSFRLTCMDGYLPNSTNISASKKGKTPTKENPSKLGDVVVGDEHGSLHLFHNSLGWREGGATEPVISRLHWHRTKVRSAKWAMDGNYVISGGAETVLVMWQIGTGHKQFLPHLGAIIENISVSPSGSSYALGLSDNSVMVLSTTELKPKANITGIQSPVISTPGARLGRLPCVLHPTSPNHLLLATPSSQTDIGVSSPYLQTFDIFSNRQISRQALARTNATIINKGPEDYSIVEPNIVHLAMTTDGEWLATIDEWRPPKRKTFPLNGINIGQDSPIRNDDDGLEVFLKFWRWSGNSKSWDLVTRVDSPHPPSGRLGAEEVLDLVAAPEGRGFATVGADGSIRIWKAKVRTRAGVQVRGEEGELVTWGCRKVIKFSKGKEDTQFSKSNPFDGTTERDRRAWWGNAAFSEDGSVVAVAAPGARDEDSTVHLADPVSGVIRHSLSGLRVGKTTGIAILERYLILLGTSKLLVWNIVSGNVQWEFGLDTLGATLKSISHLAADYQSRTFAIALSEPGINPVKASRIFIFEAPNPAPVHMTLFEFGSTIMALKASGTGKGYLCLDTQARAQWLSPVSAASRSATERVIENDKLEVGAREEVTAVGALSGVYLLDGAVATPEEDLTMSEGEGEDWVADKVVSREALQNICDAVPSYAMGPLDEVYEKVLVLFAQKPLLDEESDEEDEESKDENMVDV